MFSLIVVEDFIVRPLIISTPNAQCDLHSINIPSQEDGIIRGWVNGSLSYEKTNMIWRNPGHDNLHVRTMWLNVHKSGNVPNGNCTDMNI